MFNDVTEIQYWNSSGTEIKVTHKGGIAETFVKEGRVGWDEALDLDLPIADHVPDVEALNDKFQRTDRDMARIGEDLIVHILANGTVPAKADLDQGVIDKINARRALRGQSNI